MPPEDPPKEPALEGTEPLWLEGSVPVDVPADAPELVPTPEMLDETAPEPGELDGPPGEDPPLDEAVPGPDALELRRLVLDASALDARLAPPEEAEDALWEDAPELPVPEPCEPAPEHAVVKHTVVIRQAKAMASAGRRPLFM